MFMSNSTQVSEKQVVSVNYAQLEEVIIGLEGQTLIPFMSGAFRTKPSNMVKKSKVDGSINPFWNTEIKKEQNRRVRLVVSYKDRVDSNSGKEGIETPYTPKALSGKKHLDYCNSILTDIETETKRYIMVEWFEEIKDKPSKYLLEGTELDKAIVNKFINYPPKPTQNDQERKVNVITILFDSIVSLNVNGKTYIVEHP
jgi:hypothetical protein